MKKGEQHLLIGKALIVFGKVKRHLMIMHLVIRRIRVLECGGCVVSQEELLPPSIKGIGW